MQTDPTVTPYHGDIIDSARRLALAEHKKHRHGILPYSYHLTAVAGLVSCFTTDPEVIAAAWLHDIVEDCPDIDLEVVERMTTPRTAYLVDLLTDPPGLSRREAKAIALPRIAVDPHATLIKLADRYHNQASTIMESSQRFANMYISEFDVFMGSFERWFDQDNRHGPLMTLFMMLSGQVPALTRLSAGS